MSDDASPFAGAGRQPGRVLWVIKNNKPCKRSWCDEKVFRSGDVYIVLQTLAIGEGDNTHDIHLWRGSNAKQESVIAAEMLLIDLAEQLEGETGLYKQLQGSESVDFCELFPAGITYKESHDGGSPRHEKRRKNSVLEPKLYQLRQKKGRHPKLQPVCLDMCSLNSGGSFIFERPGYLTVWTGKFVPQRMQGKLRKVMKRIGEERGGQPEISFLQEGGTDDATMSFYASLGAEDPNNVTIAPPWPEESQTVDSPNTHSQREESTDSGDSISGVIIMGAAAEADNTEVNSRTLAAPEEQTREDEDAVADMAEGEESSAEQLAGSKGPESPKLVRMEEGKSGSDGHSVAGSESAGDMEATVEADDATPAAAHEPTHPPDTSEGEGDAANSAKALTSWSEDGEGSAQAKPKEALDPEAEVLLAEGEGKTSKTDSNSKLDLQAPAGAESVETALRAPDGTTAPKSHDNSGEASETGVEAPSEAKDQIKTSETHDEDDADAVRAKSAEEEADIAAVDKVKAIVQAPYNPAGPAIKRPHEESALDAALEGSKEKALQENSTYPAPLITIQRKELQKSGRSSGDQDAKVSVPLKPPTRPSSAGPENEGEAEGKPTMKASDKKEDGQKEQDADAKTVLPAQKTASPAPSLPGSPASQWSTSSPTAKPASMYMSSAPASSGALATPRQPREGNPDSPVHDFLRARSALRRSPSSQERAAARPPPIKCPPGHTNTRDASDLLRNPHGALAGSGESSAGSKVSSAKSQQEEFAALSRPKFFAESTEAAIPRVTVSIEPGSHTFTHEELRGMKADSGIDMARKEDYLRAEEFKEVFGRPIDDFKSLPRWKQIAAKKEKGIF